ncbi:hypothetical protein V6Z12_A02G039600 [Gossypium hirsutum]
MSQPRYQSSPPEDEPYNIISIHNLQSPYAPVVMSSLRAINGLRKPPCHPWLASMDLLDWLGLFFGFQRENVKNQWEHLVLYSANNNMRLSLPPADNIGTFQAVVLHEFHHRLLKNYTSWCLTSARHPTLTDSILILVESIMLVTLSINYHHSIKIES